MPSRLPTEKLSPVLRINTLKSPRFKTCLRREIKQRGIRMSSSGDDFMWEGGYGPKWTRGKPFQQSYFEFFDGTWKRRDPLSSPITDTSSPSELGRLSILSWNIDMMRGLEYQRMKAAVSHLRTHINGKAEPAVIMLNEMTDIDLKLMRLTDWIQRDYYMTDITDENWERRGGYGTCILIPRSMEINRVFRVHYEVTRMGRDALFVDINLPSNRTLRICSTHLESLVATPPKRPAQLATAANFMHQADASILGGDLNAIQPFDQTLHLENKLKDAYLESGGQEGAESGMTWGQMASTSQRNQFGLSRMDKLLFCGGLELLSFGTFGMDVEVEGESHREALMARGLDKGWATDHLGVKADFQIAV